MALPPGGGFSSSTVSSGAPGLSEGRPSFTFLVSWGELGAGGSAIVGLLGVGVVGYVFALDVISVTIISYNQTRFSIALLDTKAS